jgi:hypothetical protein
MRAGRWPRWHGQTGKYGMSRGAAAAAQCALNEPSRVVPITVAVIYLILRVQYPNGP